MTDTAEKYRALDALLRLYDGKGNTIKRYQVELCDQAGRYGIFWAPPQPSCAKSIRLPAWDWHRAGYIRQRATTDLVEIDVNGAWLAPISSVDLAHGQLARRGVQGGRAGYYRIDAHPWDDDRIMSPLGSAAYAEPETPGALPQTWVTWPILELLLELAKDGHWPDVTVYDSWTAQHDWTPGKWAKAVKEERALAQQERDETGDDTRYVAVKEGLTTAILSMLKDPTDSDRPSRIARRDWAQTILSAHHANTWRKAWRMLEWTEVPVLRFSQKDTITISQEGYDLLWSLDPKAPSTPINTDTPDGNGRLGAFKLKKTIPATRRPR